MKSPTFCRVTAAVIWTIAALAPTQLACDAAPPPSSAPASAGRPQPRRLAANESFLVGSDYGDKWPLHVGNGIVACVDGSSVIFTAAGTTYAINGRARGRIRETGWREIDPIQRTQQLMEVKERLDRVAEPDRRAVFAASVECEDRSPDNDAAVERCRNAVRAKNRLTVEEFKLIRNEGLALGWPPLTPLRISVSPIIDAGLKLCER